MATQPQPPSVEVVHHIPLKPPADGLSPINLLSLALQNNAAIDVIERLAALQEKAMLRDAKIGFNDALSRIQGKSSASHRTWSTRKPAAAMPPTRPSTG